jgi:hypothetical protein
MELFFLITYDKMRRRYRLALREHDYNDLEIKTLDRVSQRVFLSVNRTDETYRL